MKLTGEQIEEFRTNGVLIVKNALHESELDPVIEELEAWVDRRACELHAGGKIQKLYPDAPFETRFGFLYKQCKAVGDGLDISTSRGQAMFEFLHNQNLLDTVESLVGSEITCNPIQHARTKPPTAYDGHTGPSFHVVPWHQDAGVMMPEAEISNIVTCWLPLGDATIETGCMQALPGVFNLGYLSHFKEEAATVTIRPEVLPSVKPMDLVCCKGDVVLLNKFTPHRSVPNVSNKCRWSLDLRYQTTGHHTGRTAYPEFIVRSPSNPTSVLRDYDEWCRLWIDALENRRGVTTHRTD